MITAIRSPRGDNTISSSLTPAWVSPRVLNILSSRLSPLAATNMVVSPSPLGPRASVLVPKITSGSTSWSNPANFEDGDSTAESVSVTVNQLGNSFHLSNDQQQQGHAGLMPGAQIGAANNLANAVSDEVTKLLKVSSGFAAHVIGTADNFGTDDLSGIYEKTRDFARKVLVLDAAYLARLLELNREMFNAGEQGAYGFDGIYEQNRWTGADSGVVGYVCDGGAGGIVAVSGMPLPAPSGQFLTSGSFTLAGLGINVQAASWYNTATRCTWAALSLMFGASVGDVGRLTLLTSS